MGDAKNVMGSSSRDRDRELLIPVSDSADRRRDDSDVPSSSSPSSSSAHHHHSGRETFYKVVRSWASKKFMTGWKILSDFRPSLNYKAAKVLGSFIELEFTYWSNIHTPSSEPRDARRLTDVADVFVSINHNLGLIIVILFPIAITFYITWWFIRFVDGFFSPIYAQLGINIFGLGFVTSITFIFLVGVFMSSWLGASILALGEWFIKRMPFVRHIYNASKQISAAISPDQNTQAFKEVAIITHPRIGEYAFGFITSSVTLQNSTGEEELFCVYVPTNHLYIGDIFLVNAKDVIRPNLSVREGIEIVVSGGMSMPQILSTLDPGLARVDRNGPD